MNAEVNSAVSVFLLQSSRSLNCLCPLGLTRLIPLVWVLQHLFESHSLRSATVNVKRTRDQSEDKTKTEHANRAKRGNTRVRQAKQFDVETEKFRLSKRSAFSRLAF